MLLRFLRTTDSDAPGMPFQAGQVINVPSLTDRLARCVESGAAQVLRRDDPSELAVEPVQDRAAVRVGRGKRRKVH